MNEFEIISKDGEDIEIVQEIPALYKSSRLAGSEGMMAHCSFGDMIFWRYQGEGFEIWKSTYSITRDAMVTGRANRKVLELSAMYEQSFDIDWRHVVKGKLPFKQIEMYYAPYVENDAYFKGGKNYGTLDIHFEPSMLEPYANNFPLLATFLNKVKNNKPARLFDSLQYINHKMDAVYRDLIGYSFIDSLAPRYFDSYVNILLILLLERISGFTPLSRNFTEADREKAHEAKRILTMERVNDNEEAYTIGRLCRRLGTNPYKLKTCFKHLFGVSIGRYKKDVFMDYAKQLLKDSNHPLDEIAYMLGYRTQQSFTTAFGNHFKITPGQMRKEKFK